MAGSKRLPEGSAASIFISSIIIRDNQGLTRHNQPSNFDTSSGPHLTWDQNLQWSRVGQPLQCHDAQARGKDRSMSHSVLGDIGAHWSSLEHTVTGKSIVIIGEVKKHLHFTPWSLIL
jgi:hypothetical protein